MLVEHSQGSLPFNLLPKFVGFIGWSADHKDTVMRLLRREKKGKSTKGLSWSVRQMEECHCGRGAYFFVFCSLHLQQSLQIS
ncbi:hypothetical protein GDO81_026210 [Engystomops pustulosus]|uniref:Uncharacterized protein n=1 Tax=Engystomops pustulosus TaxID=76066 RepID=A0AAV6YNI4_ENGPU|nr:hypothetical protein GDO81_026210 [Engystomops pustulosus]